MSTEQEYAHDAQADMLVDQSDGDPNNDAAHEPFSSNFGQQPPSVPPGFTPQHPSSGHRQRDNAPQQLLQPPQSSSRTDPNQQHNIFAHGPGHPLFDPFDPMLDADPFGLSASMQFSTPFTYDQTTQQTELHSGTQGSVGQEPG